MNDSVAYDRKIRFSDTDQQGVVFNSTYLTYWDDTLTDYMDAIGLSWSDLVDRGDDMVVARTEIDYRSSAVVGDVARTTVRTQRIGRSSITFAFHTFNAETNATFVEGTQIQVVIDHDTFQSKPVPDYFRDSIVAHEGPLETTAS